jgi:tetratricopeptide (TPR) repeat protein
LLATQADGVKLTIVLTARPDESGPDHPWRRLRAELVALGRFQVLHLEGLDEREMRDYLQRRYRTTFSPDFPDWLIDTYQGHPLFIAEYLELLEREGIITKDAAGAHLDGTVEHDRTGWRATGRLAAEVRISGDTEVLLDRRIERLLDDEREVLQVGAVQGLRFDSLVLAQLTARKELAVLAELRRVLDRDHIVEVVSGEDWMRDRSETYAFEHELMRQAFYRRLGRRELILYHREIGAVLGGLASEFEVPPRQLLIAIAYHLDRGGDHAAAAAAYLRAAHASYEEGASIEAMDLCRSGLATLGVGPARPVGHEALVAETVLLLLVCGLFGPSDHALNAELLGAAADGERAAHTADLKSLLAQILAIRGRLLVRIGNVPEAIAVMRQAVALAKETGDPLTEFIATTQLGSELAKEDLAESLIVRHAANEIFEARLRSAELPSAEHELLLRQHGSLLVLIGLGEFDRGDIGRAIGWLERGVQELRERAMFDESMAALNFLAQVLTSLGLFAPARDHLEESLRIHDTHHRDRANPWVGYNLALLAHVLFETGDVESAVETMAQAVQASEASEHIDLLTHVLIYQAQLLIEPGNSHGDLEEAWQVLNKNNELSESAGLRWSETMGASLMGQVLLRRGALDGAQTHSARALAEIDAHGDLPAVRTEEILFNHWLVLEALARHEEAARILDRAWEVVQRKLGSLTQDEHRVAFLREVRLNRLIAEAHEARAAEWRAGP